MGIIILDCKGIKSSVSIQQLECLQNNGVANKIKFRCIFLLWKSSCGYLIHTELSLISVHIRYITPAVWIKGLKGFLNKFFFYSWLSFTDRLSQCLKMTIPALVTNIDMMGFICQTCGVYVYSQRKYGSKFIEHIFKGAKSAIPSNIKSIVTRFNSVKLEVVIIWHVITNSTSQTWLFLVFQEYIRVSLQIIDLFYSTNIEPVVLLD